MRTLVGVFEQLAEAESAVKELETAGFSRDGMSIIVNRAKCGPSLGPVENVMPPAGPGAGAAVGGLAGFAAGIVALAVPGIGPILAAGPLVAGLTGAGAGAAAGAMIAKLRQLGASEEEAGCYCEAVRRGGILLSVDVPAERAAEAEEIIGKHRLADLEDCAAEWSQEGWKGFDPSGEPAPAGLPFVPERVGPSAGKERRERRSVRSYIRIR